MWHTGDLYVIISTNNIRATGKAWHWSQWSSQKTQYAQLDSHCARRGARFQYRTSPTAKRCDTQRARVLILRQAFHFRSETVRMVTAITIIAKQQLVIILRCSTNCATLTFDALPSIAANNNRDVIIEVKARGVSRSATVMTHNEILRFLRLLVHVFATQTQITDCRYFKRRRDFYASIVWQRIFMLKCFVIG